MEVFELMCTCLSGKEADDFVVTREGGSRVVDPREGWYDLCVDSGQGQFLPSKRKNGEEFLSYQGLNLHDFRRSAIRNVTRRGVSELVAMAIGGRQTLSVFRRDKIIGERDLRQASKLMAAGSSVVFSAVRTDTKTDTPGYAGLADSRSSLN